MSIFTGIHRALVVAAVAATSVVLVAGPAAARGSVPYTDPAAVGRITLCDTRGHVLTHGDVRTKPFVWRAVGSSAAPAPYNGPGRTTALYGFQPVRNVAPTQWFNGYLTASARYTSRTRPMAAATAVDPALADFLVDYPTKWDGLVQLRMTFGVPGQATATTPYNAATIKVSGHSWRLLDGGHSGCRSGTAQSAEMILPNVRKLGTPAPNATTVGPAARAKRAGPARGPSSPGARSGDGSGGTSALAAAGNASQVSHASRPPAGSSATPWLLSAFGVLLLVGGAAWLRWRKASGHG